MTWNQHKNNTNIGGNSRSFQNSLFFNLPSSNHLVEITRETTFYQTTKLKPKKKENNYKKTFTSKQIFPLSSLK